MNKETVGIIFSWFGMVMATFLFLSPAKTFYRIAKEGTVSQFDSTPYLVSSFNCALWVSYALVTPNRLMPLVTNAIGLSISLAWCCIFAWYSAPGQKSGMIKRILTVLTLWAVITFSDVLFSPEISMQPLPGMSLETELLGFACVFVNILMYGAPLVVVRKVMKTRSVEFMPLPLSVMTFLCSFCWFSYGFTVGDPWILTPNGMGLALGVTQLSIYAYYCRESSSQSDLEAPLNSNDCNS